MGYISVIWTCYKSLVNQKLDLEDSELEVSLILKK